MKWIALAFVVLYVGAIVIGKLVNAAFDYFQVDGNHSAGACPLTKGGTRTESVTPSDSPPTMVGSPGAVDASHGPTDPFRDEIAAIIESTRQLQEIADIYKALPEHERMKLNGIVEVHKLQEGIVPPPSRSIRSSKVH